MDPPPRALIAGLERGGLGLVLVPGAKERLSKAQVAFRRLVARIEKLRRKIEQDTERMEGCLEVYSTAIRPLEVELAHQRKSVVRLLLPYLNGPALGRRNGRSILRGVIREQLLGIIAVLGDLVDEDLLAVFEAVEGRSMKDVEAEDFEMMKDELGELLGSLGVDADLSGFRPGMSVAEEAARMAELRARIDEEQTNAGESAERPKTQRQRDREAKEQAAEALRKRDVGGLYRQLAKLLHPDLEQDPELRAEKEAAMKELTTAYKDNDLHGMLRLEVAWMAREQADASRLTDQKLAIYNKVLKEQVADLEDQLAQVMAHPRFHPLMKFVDPFFRELNFNGSAERRFLQTELKALKRTIEALQGPRADEKVAEILAAHVPREQRPLVW